MKRPHSTLAAVLACAWAVLAAACGTRAGGVSEPDGGGSALACTVQAPTECPDPAPHFADIQPILQERCVSCHYGAVGGPWPLVLYSHVADWQDIVRTSLLDCSMPPADAGISMSDGERTAILTWLRCGYLE